MSTSGTRAPKRSRSPSTWPTTMSRKVCPSLASISDLALVMPMLVPSPPLSFSTTAVSTIAGSPSGSSSSVGRSATGSMSLSGSIPEAPSRNCS